MTKRYILAILPLALLVVLPILLRERAPVVATADDQILVILTPHTESNRYEFEHAFQAWYLAKTGKNVAFDWRTPGGTSDITRYIEDQYQSAFRRYWQAAHGDAAWTPEIASAFNNRRLDPTDESVPAAQREARAAFLATDEVGIGVDLFFGGGQYDHSVQASEGHLVDGGVQQRHPDWFAPEIIPASYSGEIFYDPDGRYYGAALSSFGLCYNPDRIAMLADPTPPTRWTDLGDPRFENKLGVADPTKSGSITKCFEMLIQQQMHDSLAAANAVAATSGAPLADDAYAAALAAGWDDGFNLIKRIGGNARYFTDSASKIPRDVAAGDLAAGMCIDFYGRSQADFSGYQSGGTERVIYMTPTGGSSISVDPIALLRGAPHRELAEAFLDFVLSQEGQRIWNYRHGEPGGPVKYSLRRLPVRRDVYTAEDRSHMADPTVEPYEEAKEFVYKGGWTGRYFSLIRVLIRCMVLDADEELKEGWIAICDAGGPAAVPEAMAAFNAMPFDYAAANDSQKAISPDGKTITPLDSLATQREWAAFFRAQYLKAAELARAGR